MNIRLKKFPYRYMEYEKRMMHREIAAILPSAQISNETKDIISIDNDSDVSSDVIELLVLFQQYSIDNGPWEYTIQGKFENEDLGGKARQHTRYSSHGLHEYKGKFNPQIVRIMLNILDLNGKKVLDPFDGSGTSILECAHIGTQCVGTDINPLACFIANTKVNALSIDIDEARRVITGIIREPDMDSVKLDDSLRMQYLKRWMPEDNLKAIEYISSKVDEITSKENIKNLLLVIASDLIRDYSNQEPSDLRIRKRISPFPEIPLLMAFDEECTKLLNKIEYIQKQFGIIRSDNHAICCDIKNARNPEGRKLFDGAITSPPYVTALPYIDTQRISLVWLGLCEADEIMSLEGTLIGSREFKNHDKNQWISLMETNGESLPEDVYNLILDMQNSLSDTDGFRKRAMPSLTYRYFADMKNMFCNVKKMLKVNAPYALIVGHNKTTLGGKVFHIDTPDLLGKIAVECGWELEELIPLDTYKRYGLNAKNGINSETMIILRNTKIRTR